MNAAKRYIGTPYRHGGSDSLGMDCSGLVYAAFLDGLGVRLPRTVSSLRAFCYSVNLRQARSGDILFFAIEHPGRADHLGIYLGEGQFIHAAKSTGVIVSSLESPYHGAKLLAIGRPRLGPAGDVSTALKPPTHER